MAQSKNKFVCQECGYTTPRSLGKCPECQTWDSFAEEREAVTTSPLHRNIGESSNKPELISEVTSTDVERHLTGMVEFRQSSRWWNCSWFCYFNRRRSWNREIHSSTASE